MRRITLPKHAEIDAVQDKNVFHDMPRIITNQENDQQIPCAR